MRRKLPNAGQKVTALALILFTSSAQAASLADYRKCSHTEGYAAAASARSLKIRKALGTANIPAPKLFIPDSFGESSRVNFSTHMKDILEEGSSKLYEELRHGTPAVIDPAQGVAEFKEQKAHAREVLVMNEFNDSKNKSQQVKLGLDGKPLKDAKGAPVVENVTGISALVSDLFSHIVSAQKSKKLNQSNPSEEAKYKSIIEQHIASAPVATFYGVKIRDGKKETKTRTSTVRDALGKLNDLEIREGEIDEMHFVSDSQTPPVSLQLNMLLTYRTGQDNVYLEVLRILSHYFDEQYKVLSKRSYQLEHGMMNPAGLSTWTVLKNTFVGEEAPAFKVVGDYFSGDSDAAKASVKKMLTQAAEEDPDQVYRVQLRRFLENPKIKFGSPEEKAFIVTRLKKLAVVRSFMQKQFLTSLETNKKLKLLSLDQVNYLLDMFLQLRGNDILTQKESAGLNLSRYFGPEASQCVKGKGNTAVDYVYYRVNEKLVSHLETVLAEEVLLEKGKKKDLETLSRHKPH